jgi:hypothetical protein
MDEIADHVARPVDDYHMNRLSMQKLRDDFESRGCTVEVIHIPTFLRMCLHCAHTHNPNAYTFYVWFDGGK